MSVSQSRNMSLCIMCRNCFGKCSWSKDFRPVDGWTVKATYGKNGDLKRAWVGWCPEFRPDKVLCEILKEKDAKKARWHIQQEYGYITPLRYAVMRYNIMNNCKGVKG